MTGSLHGYVVVDKPAGWTSHDVVGRLRRLLRERKIGHAGTLDPAATGVLPLAVGDATKTLEYLTDASKTYQAAITFGIETDSYDADGRVTAIADGDAVDRAAIESALLSMLGPQQQIPPMHSAVKIAGKRLYESARAGVVVERPARPVTFHTLQLVEWRPPVAEVVVDCSKGTYVRSLANDLGRMVGCGAHLSNLVRLRSGPFDLSDAWTIGELTALADSGADAVRHAWPTVAFHPDVALTDLPAVLLGDDDARRWQQGGTVPGTALPGPAPAGAIRAYDASGAWIGVGDAKPGRRGWSPTKVVQVPSSSPNLDTLDAALGSDFS